MRRRHVRMGEDAWGCVFELPVVARAVPDPGFQQILSRVVLLHRGVGMWSGKAPRTCLGDEWVRGSQARRRKAPSFQRQVAASPASAPRPRPVHVSLLDGQCRRGMRHQDTLIVSHSCVCSSSLDGEQAGQTMPEGRPARTEGNSRIWMQAPPQRRSGCRR